MKISVIIPCRNERRHIAAFLDHFAEAHGGQAPIVVMPDENGTYRGDTECVDGPQGNAQTYLSEDVRNYVISTFGASPNPQHWAVVGLSEGGTCATLLAVKCRSMTQRMFADTGKAGKRRWMRASSQWPWTHECQSKLP